MNEAAGRLAGKVAIITGASGGCGPVIAQAFVDEGAKVLLSARSENLVLEAAAAIGENAVGIRADVTNEDDVAAMVDRALEEFGQVDILLNNAAAPGTDKYVWEQTLDNWNSTIAVDVTAAMLCSREVLRRSMLERRSGTIVNFSSTAGWHGMARKSHYSTAKAALRTLTKVIALEVGEYGIRCNCLVPGNIETDLWRRWGARMAAEQGIEFDEWRTQSLSTIPLRSISQTSDIASLALFLASDESRNITGQSITCDGGGVMVG